MIAISELVRVCGNLTIAKNASSDSNKPVTQLQQENDQRIKDLEVELSNLRQVNESLNARLQDKESHILDLRTALKLLELKVPVPESNPVANIMQRLKEKAAAPNAPKEKKRIKK